MAPGGGGKRKRGDRNYSVESLNEGSRPSPHRPSNLNLAQQNYVPHQYSHRDGQERGRGGRRGSRGGRGQLRSPHTSPSSMHLQRNSNTSPQSGTPPVPSQFRTEELTVAVDTNNESNAVTNSTQTSPPGANTSQMYAYEYFTNDILGSWNESGQVKMLDLGTQIIRDRDLVSLGLFFQEIIKSAVDRRLDATLAGSLVAEVLGAKMEGETEPLEFNAPSSFLDNISILNHQDSDLPILKALLTTSAVSLQTMREEFDLEFLVNVGLTRNTFERMRTRFQTNVLYRQSNYNLLREESEGYSKLITELFTTSGNEPPNSAVILGTYQRVKAMIGAFDLDVGRVLDITLDVFAAVLVRHYRFFVKYLRASTWWPEQMHLDELRSSEMSFRTLPKWALPEHNGFDGLTTDEKSALADARDQRDSMFWDRVRAKGIAAFFELGGKNVAPSDVEREIKGKGAEADEMRKWTESTGITPPSGNKVAAQVLGFKLRFYCSSARSTTDVLPGNLVYLSALLIKIGFISLKDLYAHLWPEDSSMEAVKEQKMQEKLEREKMNRPGGGAINALMAAGALSDDTIPTSSTSRIKEAEASRGTTSKSEIKDETSSTAAATESKDDLQDPIDQKVQLFKSLLCIGALPEALYLLGRFPWLLDAFPELPDYVHRIVHHCLAKIYEPLQPLSKETNVREPHKIVDSDLSGLAKGSVRRIDQPSQKVLRWAQLDRYEGNEGIDYRFYWDDWADNIPICQTIDDVFALCGSLLNYTGVKIGQDTSLLTKLARIGKHSLTSDASEHNKARWIDLSKRLLVPALSLTKHNSGTVAEVWDLIKLFTTSTRYSIYAEWYTGQISRLPDIKSAFDQSKAETKDVLKRISKTNLKPMARALSKVSTSSPGIVFSVAIGQIESYENLVEVVVECARYFTYLGYDVLTWSLMNSLGARGRNRVQADGMLTSKWLAALSLFSGKVFKRYGIMNPTPILQYVADQLRKGNSTDLIVLEEIISSMAGIVSETNFNDSQVIAMGGGRLLQSQTMLQLLDRRHENSMRSTAKRLMKSLVDPRLVGPLLISIAQERQTCIFKIAEPDAHLKLLGNLFDEIHRVLIQYLDLLRSNLSIKEFNQHVPSVTELIGEFGLEPSVAFWISRPSIAADMSEYDKKAAYDKKESTQSQAEVTKPSEAEDMEMDVPEAKSANPTSSRLPTEGVTALSSEENEDTNLKEALHPESTPTPLKLTDVDRPWHPVLQSVMESTADLIPSKTWTVLSDSFYFTFWQMSLEDIFVPMASYDEENNRLKKKSFSVTADRSDMTVRGNQRKDEEKKAINELQTQLQAEMGVRIGSYQRTKQRLSKEKDFWFVDCWGRWDILNIAIIEHCFIPRILLSAIDSMYTFKLFKHLHSIGTKNFRTIGLLDQLFNGKRLTALIFLSTAQEAENVGRFFNEIIKDLARWHADKAIFEKEAHGSRKDLPGFRLKFSEEKDVTNLMDYEDFRRILQKWHMNLHTALKTCFQGGEYMHIRNAIVILKSLALHFPVINWMGQNQVSMVSELSKSETRGDLKLAAMSLLGNLKRREKDWILPQAFMLSKGPANGVGGSKIMPKADTPQPDTNFYNKLNAKAPEFKPRSPVIANGISNTILNSIDKADFEDGEVNSPGLAPKSDAIGAIAAVQHAQVNADSRNKVEHINEKSNELEASQNASNLERSSDKSTIPDKPVLPLPPARQTESSSKLEMKLPNLPAVPPKPPANGRPPHTLPNRPDATSGPSRPSDPREGASERTHPSELPVNRFPEQRRDQRRSEYPREHHKYGNARQEYERQPSTHTDERTPSSQILEGRYSAPSHRESRVPARDERPERHIRERGSSDYVNLRNNEGSDRQSRDGSMAPPRVTSTSHSERSTTNQAQQDDSRGFTNHSDRRSELSRPESSNNNISQRGSRPTSPVRREERLSRSDHHTRDDRMPFENRRNPDEAAYSRSRYEGSRFEDSRLQNGVRNDRAPEVQADQHDGNRANYGSGPPNNVSSNDPSRSRHLQDNERMQQESSFGRLNPDPPSGPPSGPRSNGPHHPPSRSIRIPASAPVSVNTQIPLPQHSMPSPSIPEKQAPTGPASGRPQPRSSSSFGHPATPSSSAPPTPVLETPDASSVHPDRLKAIQGSEIPPVSLRTHNAPAAAPSGPRGPNNSQPPSPINARGNMGPQPFQANDRARSDKRFAGLNTILQQPNTPPGSDRLNPGTSIRGRSTRSTNAVQSFPVNTPLARSEFAGAEKDHPRVRDAQASTRQDLFPNRAVSGPSVSHHEDERPTGEENDHRPQRRREARSVSPRRHIGPPALAVPPSAMDDGRLFQRSDEPLRREEQRDLRTRNGPPLPVNNQDNRRGPRDEIGGGRGGRDHDRERRERLREQGWAGVDRMGIDVRGRERRDVGPERRDSGPSPGQGLVMQRGPGIERGEQGPGMERRDQGPPVFDSGGSMGRKRLRPPTEDSYDIGKRNRR